MTDTRPRVLPLAQGRPGPAVISHRGGNSLEGARAAIAERADFLEVDLWVIDGRFEARHERRVSWLPFLFEKWYLSRAPRRPFGLRELLDETAGQIGVLLDLKNGGATAARLVERSVREAAAPVRVAASSQHWKTLRAVLELAPHVDAYYSIDVQAKLDLFLSVIERDARPKGVSCRATLLTPAVIRRLHERGLLVIAWTVDDLDRAEELASWGVDGITTHKVEEIRERLGLPA